MTSGTSFPEPERADARRFEQDAPHDAENAPSSARAGQEAMMPDFLPAPQTSDSGDAGDAKDDAGRILPEADASDEIAEQRKADGADSTFVPVRYQDHSQDGDGQEGEGERQEQLGNANAFSPDANVRSGPEEGPPAMMRADVASVADGTRTTQLLKKALRGAGGVRPGVAGGVGLRRLSPSSNLVADPGAELSPDADPSAASARLAAQPSVQRDFVLRSGGDTGEREQVAENSDHVADRMRHLLPLLRSKAASMESHPVQGRVVAATGTIIRAILPNVAVGDLCQLRDRGRGWTMNAEVVGLSGREVLLTPMGGLEGVSAETEVLPTGGRRQFPVGQRVLGRVLDALGVPMDGKGALGAGPTAPVDAKSPDAMRRRMIERPMPIGLRAIDSVLTCGEGQRVGIYGEAGAGKSTLMASIVKGSDADVAVVALVGERGREVREFVEHNLGSEGLARSVLVVATSDRPAAERVACAQAASAVAEYFRDQGLRVLLFVDNVTRFARAIREIGLAAGEPPTRRGFPPSVFTALPKLMERAGMGERGSITAFYAVLVEDGQGDPVAEETRGILDGHIILSRALAASGHYPAIDILTSRSRVMSLVTSPEHRAHADRLRALWARYQEVAFLLQVGEYKPGGDPLADEAIAKVEEIRRLLRQGSDERTAFPEVVEWMTRLLA